MGKLKLAHPKRLITSITVLIVTIILLYTTYGLVFSEKQDDILLVNRQHPLPANYQPQQLVHLYTEENKHFQLSRQDIYLSDHVFRAMEDMFAAAQRDGIEGFIITSGYRSQAEQNEIYSASNDGVAAAPGESEHETGLAFDVTARGNEVFALTPQYAWLFQNCGDYGFILRYPEGKENITGYPYESWHYRYVGLPYAKEIMDAGITLEEYLANQ